VYNVRARTVGPSVGFAKRKVGSGWMKRGEGRGRLRRGDSGSDVGDEEEGFMATSVQNVKKR